MSKAKQKERELAKTDIRAFINTRYDKIVDRCNGNGKAFYKDMDRMSREEFMETFVDDDNLHELHKRWRLKGYLRKDIPSIDRIDPKKGYILGNVRWLTLSENSKSRKKVGDPVSPR